MKKLEPGKFYLTREGHNLWKTDSSGANRVRNQVLKILLPGTMVLFTRFGKFRYIQVVFEDVVGYIWCNTNISVHDHLEPVTEDSLEELQEAMKADSGWRARHHIRS